MNMLQIAPSAAAARSAPVSLALIGMGRQGARHLLRADRMREEVNLNLAAIVDPDPRCAEQAARLGIPFFEDVDALPPHIDAAIVATPTRTHLDVGRRLLERGIDLLIEKPVASGLAQTQALVQLAEQRQCIFQVGYLERYHRSFRASKPDFSSPASVVSHRTTRGTDIGAVEELVLELMIHDLDMLATWLDCAPATFAWTRIERAPHCVSAELEIQFSAGHRARLIAQSGAHEVIRHTQVTAGSHVWDFDWGSSGASSLQSDEYGIDPISAQLRAFVNAVRTRTHPSVNGHAALKAMQLAERAIRALPARA